MMRVKDGASATPNALSATIKLELIFLDVKSNSTSNEKKTEKMKLFSLLSITSVLGKVDRERGKGGRTDMSSIRSEWKDPVCVLNPVLCADDCGPTRTFTSLEGEINLSQSEYRSNKNCKWTIEVPPGKEIRLQWVRMDLEWHKLCAFDKVHIVDMINGSRLGRWCGPRYHDPVNTPWDGERRFRRRCSNKGDRESCEPLPMWDNEFNTLSNKIVVAFDSDSSHTVRFAHQNHRNSLV